MFRLTYMIAVVNAAAVVAGPPVTAAQDGSTTRFVDSAGRGVAVPDDVAAVYPGGPPAAILLYALAPERLLAWPRALSGREAAYVAQPYRNLPAPGRLSGRGDSASLEHALTLGPDRSDHEAAWNALESLGIDALAERAFTRISGGQRQLTLIARALAQRSAFIVMDEPAASLDFGNQARVLAQVSSLRGHGVGVIVSTHDPGHALRVADRVLVMHDGGMVAAGAPGETLSAALMAQVYGVDVAIGDVVDTGSGARIGHTCIPLYGGTRDTGAAENREGRQ